MHSIEYSDARKMPPLLEAKLPAQLQARAIVRKHECQIRREPQLRSPNDRMLHQLRCNTGALSGWIDIDTHLGSGGVGRPSIEWLETQPSQYSFLATGILENPDGVFREIAVAKPGTSRVQRHRFGIRRCEASGNCGIVDVDDGWQIRRIGIANHERHDIAE